MLFLLQRKHKQIVSIQIFWKLKAMFSTIKKAQSYVRNET